MSKQLNQIWIILVKIIWLNKLKMYSYFIMVFQ